MDTIPVVDFSPILNEPSESDWAGLSEEVDRILSGIGFVYIKNHGVPAETIEEAFKESRGFFELPSAWKLKYLKDATKGYSGYAEPNQELLDPSSAYSELRESFDISQGLAHRRRSLEAELPRFQSALLDLQAACHPLIDKLHRILARGLGLLDTEYFVEASKNLREPAVRNHSGFRTLYYPPVPEGLELDPGTVRCAPHSDYGTLTLLFQDQVGGLEVTNAEGNWVPADPIPGTILVNTGDLLYFWSGGKYPATVHRVLLPETEVKKRLARQVITYFVHPDGDLLVSPLSSTGADEIPPVTAYEHAQMKLERSYKY